MGKIIWLSTHQTAVSADVPSDKLICWRESENLQVLVKYPVLKLGDCHETSGQDNPPTF